MATRLQLWALECALRLLRAIGFLAAVIWVYVLLHRSGLWYPVSVEDYWFIALLCAASIALGRRFPLVQLVGMAVLVGNPFWNFSVGEIRAVPLVLAAFLTGYAGLRAAIALPLVIVAALSSQYPLWIDLARSPAVLAQFVLELGLSQPLLVAGIAVGAALVGRASFLQLRTAASLRQQNEELARLRESDRERIANEERTAIAREVHDVVAHHIAAIVVRAQAAARVADRTPEEPRAAVEWIAEAGPQALAEMRSLVRVLRDDSAAAAPPVALATLGAQIEAVIARVRTAGLDVRARLEPPAGLSAVQEFAVLRVCQEALTNVLVHSAATAVELRLFAAGDDAVLLVEDNGALAEKGIEARQVDAGATGGSGIRGMRERASAVGGVVSAGPSDVGWRVELVVPRTASPFAVPELTRAEAS